MQNSVETFGYLPEKIQGIDGKTIQPIISRMCDQLTNPGHVPLRVGQFARYAKCAKRKVCGVLSNCKFLFESVIRSITKNS